MLTEEMEKAREELRGHCRLAKVKALAADIGVSRQTLTNFLGGARVSPSTLGKVRGWLDTQGARLPVPTDAVFARDEPSVSYRPESIGTLVSKALDNVLLTLHSDVDASTKLAVLDAQWTAADRFMRTYRRGLEASSALGCSPDDGLCPITALPITAESSEGINGPV